MSDTDSDPPPSLSTEAELQQQPDLATTTTTAAESTNSIIYDWSAFYDDGNEEDNGEPRLYYYNSVTEESSWDPPADGLFNPPPSPPQVTTTVNEEQEQQQQQVSTEETVPLEKKNEENFASDRPSSHGGLKSENDKEEVERSRKEPESHDASVSNHESDAMASTNPDIATTETVTTKVVYDWSAYYDEEGRIYYYNSTTEESVWEPPTEGFNPPEEDDYETRVGTEAGTQNNSQDELKVMEKGVMATDDSQSENANRIDDDNDIDDDNQINEMDHESKTTNADKNHIVTTAPTPATSTPWIAYQDDEGREYYYNEQTGETQWEEPESYRRAEEMEEDGGGDNEDADMVERKSSRQDTTKDMDTDSMENNDNQGSARHHDGGSRIMNETMMDTVTEDVDDTSPHDIPMIDPAVQRLKDAEDAIHSPDSILEPTCMVHVAEMVKADGGNASRAISALIDHYYGQTAVCGLLTRWYLDLCKHHTTPNQLLFPQSQPLTTGSNKSSTTTISKSHSHADHIRNVIQNVITKVAKEKYTKEAGDSILDLSRADVTFLEDMMESPRWRTLLIDLSASYKDSAVLLYCLRAISKRGHHREIAQRINISDHFTVFNAMLLSELSVIGQQAISTQSDIIAATTFHDLIRDIIKACTATSYTYLYSIQLLRTLIQMSRNEWISSSSSSLSSSATAISESTSNRNNNDMEIENSSQIRLRRAIYKWEALLELLEGSMVDPSNGKLISGSSTASPLLRRRQLEVALTISDLHQRQRWAKRKRAMEAEYEGDVDDDNQTGPDQNQDRLENAVAMLLKRHSMGIQIDDSVLDKLLPSGLDVDTCGVGELLIKYPIAVQALLGHLYKPGPTRITSPSTKNKCARLIALSMFAAEKSEQMEVNSAAEQSGKNAATDVNDDDDNTGDEVQTKNEVTVTQQIVQGSVYCEQLETMISFLVTTNDSDLTSRRQKGCLTVGEKLCLLALSITPIGLGVAMWAREFTQGKEYATAASYPTLSQSILSLVRLVALRHPFARPDALHVGLALIRHTNSEVSYQKVNSIKECALRLLIFLMIEGDIVPVLSALTQRVQQVGNSELDASLIRYFVGGVLDVVQSPVSPIFMRMFGLFLMSSNVMDAVRSSYFAESNRKKLLALVNAFYSSNPSRSQKDSAQEDVRSLVSALISTYR